MARRRSSKWGRWTAIAAVLGIVLWLGWSLTKGRVATDGFASFATEDWETAQYQLEDRLGARPDDDRARYYLGVSYRHRRLEERALGTLTALRASPEWRERAFYQVVRTLLDAEQLTDAVSEIEQMEPALAPLPLAREARGLVRLAQGDDIEKRILERLERAIGDRETGMVKGNAQRILRADAQTFAPSLERFIVKLREERRVADAEALEPLFKRGQGAFLKAQSNFLGAIEAAEADPAMTEVARSRYEVARILEARRRGPQTEEMRRSLVTLAPARLNGDLDLEIEYGYLRRRAIESLGQQLLRENRAGEVQALVELIPQGRKGRRPYRFESLLAQAYASLGDEEALYEITESWLQADSTPAQMQFLRGEYHVRRQEYELAIHHLEKAHNAVPGRRTYRSVLARAYAAISNYDRAQKHWDFICRAEPRNWNAHLARIECLEGLKWTEEARQEISRLLQTEFSDRRSAGHQALREYMDAFLERNGMAARDLYSARKLYTEDPQNFEAGTRYLEYLTAAGDLGTATRVAKRLTEDLPSDHPAAYEVSMACAQLALERSDYDEAQKCFIAAAAERPYEAAAFAGEARAELGAGRPEAAWRAVEKIRILAPDNPKLKSLEFDLYALSNDNEQIAACGLALIEEKGEDADWPLIRRTAEATLATESPEIARELLTKAKNLEKGSASEELAYALLLDQAGRSAEAESLTFKIVAANADDDRLVAKAARRYLEKDRPVPVINALRPLVEDNDLASNELIELLALAYEKEGNVGERLEMLSRLRRRDAKGADLAVARFCAAREQWVEVLSVTANARAEKRLQAPLLRLAAEAALQLKDVAQAEQIAQELKIELDTEFTDNAMVKARLLEATLDVEGARTVLEESLTKARPGRRPEIRAALVNLFGRSGQATAMMSVIQAAIDAGEDANELAPIAARHVLRLGLPNAAELVNESVERFDAPTESVLDRGLLRLARRDKKGALEDIRSAHAEVPTPRAAQALLLTYALLRDSSRMNQLMLPSETTAQPQIDVQTKVKAEIIRALHHASKTVLNQRVQKIAAASEAERETYIQLIEAIAALGEGKNAKAPLARTALTSFWILQRFPWMRSEALNELTRLEEILPGQKRTFAIMRARTLMQDTQTWSDGVAVIARLMESSSMSDEAALMIYLEQYLRNGETTSVRLLVDMMLRGKSFSERCYRDGARLLLASGRPQAAARLLHRSPESSGAKKLLEAQALLAVGAPSRAEALLSQLPSDIAALPEALTLKARLLLRDPERRQSAYRYANQALRDFPLDDPRRLLLHARCCFAVDRAEEGWNSIDRWVAWNPASAAQLSAAIDTVNNSEIVDGKNRDRLYARLRLLDPAALIRTRQ